ncbi:XAC2610-related protein [Saccharophagus degradans]|uniref:Uncharacterized protein n=1 Tax=Saccharophagus degradans (strain 2-40 / ATCC 43961 / DSM 17024) TaxID=203122 RepID=Q21GZ1_SACD2|nr:hypothetical protein [Saccharophagus degradans]ABD82038.1 hypothetical protein Sde_2778 [Saccharophagus degradans 2-40]
MKLEYILLFMLIISAGVHAESELSSPENVFPFKYKPTPNLELVLTKENSSVRVVYPNGNAEEITTLETRNWNDNYNITKDFNFDGFIDLGIWVGVAPRGLNENYDIFIWDEKEHKLRKVTTIVNPDIEEAFLVENIIDTTCQDSSQICVHSRRYKIIGDEIIADK